MTSEPQADLVVGSAADLGPDQVRAVAAGAILTLAPELLASLAERRVEVTAALRGRQVYGVTTGMGALSGTLLTELEQADHSRRLMLARAVGGPPWLDRAEARAVVAARLATFLTGDAGVSAELCAWLDALLREDALPAIPRTGSGAAGEIIPLAHAWGGLAGVGAWLDREPVAEPPELGPKEGIALLAGVPVATALALLRSADARLLVDQTVAVAAGSALALRASYDPYRAATARGDAELGEVLGRLRALLGPEAAPTKLQAPVSFRVIGPVLAHLTRSANSLDESAARALTGVTDSPAYLGADIGFVGTSGFHGLDLAAGSDSLRAAVTHTAAVSAARLHRLLDPTHSGLPAQLSAQPGPQAGLVPVHKRAVAALHAVAGLPSSIASPAETSHGQEDVQTFALEAAERLRLALAAAREVLACELLAVHQARCLAPDRFGAGTALPPLLDEVAKVLPAGVEDRPWGRDLEALVGLLGSGWGRVDQPEG